MRDKKVDARDRATQPKPGGQQVPRRDASPVERPDDPGKTEVLADSRQHQNWHSEMAAALEGYVSAEAAASLRAAFTLRDRNDIRSLVAEGGFRDIRIRIRNRLTRYPSLAEYVLGYLSGTPMAGPVAALDDVTRREMVEHVCSCLREYVDDDGMAAPWEAHLVTAQV